MKRWCFGLSAIVGFTMACSAADRAEVQPVAVGESADAVLIDTVQWNSETLSFYDATSEEGPGVVVSFLGSSREPELSVTLENQLGRQPTAAELWLATGGAMEDVPAELLVAHNLQALEEDRDTALQRPEVDVSGLEEEKAIPQSTFNQMFPINMANTGVPAGTPVCWDALITQTALNFGGKRVCSSNGNAVVNWVGTLQCDPVLDQNTTVRTAFLLFSGRPATGLVCFGTGPGEQCQPPVTVNSNFFFGGSFFKNGQRHRIGTGAIYQGGDSDTTIQIGSATLRGPALQAFQSTTCTQH